MMETINSGSSTCPVKSDRAPASATNSSTLKIRTPAEINREFDATSNSAESSDRHDSSSSLDLLPPNTSPSFPHVTTRPSEKVQERSKSRYSAFEDTISSASGEDQKKNYVGINASNLTSVPKTKSSTNPVVFNLHRERQVGISGSLFKSCLFKSSSSEKLQERTSHAPIKFAKVPIGSEVPTSVILTEKDVKDIVSKVTLYNPRGNVPAKPALNELGTRPGGGTGTKGIKHPGQGITVKQTDFVCRRLNFESSSVSLASSPGESVKSKAGIEGSIPGESAPFVEGSTASESVKNQPYVEGSTAGESLKDTSYVEGSRACESVKIKSYEEESTPGNSVQNKPVVEGSTKDKPMQNKPGMEGTSIWKNSSVSGQIADSTVTETVEINKCNGSTSSAKKPRRRSREVWETAKPVSKVNTKGKASFVTQPNLEHIHSEKTVKIKNTKSGENVNQDSGINKDITKDEEMTSEPIEGEAKYPIDVKISEYFCKRPNQLSGYNISQSLKDQFVNDESLPLGWKIKKTWRQNNKNYDIEYLSPDGRKARSRVAVIEYMKLLGNYSQKDYDTVITNYNFSHHKKVSKSGEEDQNSSNKQFSSAEQSHVRNSYQGFGKVAYAVNSQDNDNKSDEQHSKMNKSRKRRGVIISEQNNNVAPKIANCLTESTLGDFSSGFTKKTDENDNLYKCEVKNYDCSYEDTSLAMDTEDCERKKLLDGVVMAISGYEDPLRGRIARKAVAMGAKYRTQWTNDCSHLVCGFPGTFKYLQAKGRGKIVLGTWIEDCHKFKKKVDCKEYILSEEKTTNKPAEVTFSPKDGLRFLFGMEVRLKESCLDLLKGQLFEQMAGKTGWVKGIFHDRVQVMMPCCTQVLVSPADLQPLMPEKGDKAKSIVKGQGENVVEVIGVRDGDSAAVVRYDGYKGALVQRNHLCRIAQGKAFS